MKLAWGTIRHPHLWPHAFPKGTKFFAIGITRRFTVFIGRTPRGEDGQHR